MNLRSFRPLIDGYFPFAAKHYRLLRDRRALNSLRLENTPFGFSILGGNSLASGAHESAELAIASDFLGDVDVMLDIGANVGLYSCLAAAAKLPAIAIEPVAMNLEILYRNLIANDFVRHVEVFPVAISDHVSLLPIYGRGQGASLIENWDGRPTNDAVIVPTTTLDNLFAARLAGKRIFLKIDVEGAEESVLNGAVELLGDEPVILLELSLTRNHPNGINPRFGKIFEHLWSRNYRSYAADGSGHEVTPDIVATWVAQRRAGVEGENFLFVPEWAAETARRALATGRNRSSATASA